MKSFKEKLVRSSQIVTSLLSQINDLESNFELPKEDIDRLKIINEEIESIKVSFNDLNDCNKNHSFPYTKLSSELDYLIIKLSKIDESLDYDVHTKVV